MSFKKCIFCSSKIFSRVILKNRNAFAIYDANPVTNGHCLIILKKHKKSFFNLTKNEILDIYNLITKLKKIILKKNTKGFNLGVNYGVAAGQTINHCHFHLIPRTSGDFDLRLKKNFFWIK
jgi:diadenosine tetraphosphate (Ap4A) HIT family hydrolase